MHWISGAWGGSLIYAGTTAFPTAKWGVWRNSLPSRISYRKEDSCCLATWPEWTRQLTPGGFWLMSIRAIGAGQLGAPTPSGWPLWRATYLCTILTFEDAIELALDKSLWRLLVASGAMHWHGAWRKMMMMIDNNVVTRWFRYTATVTLYI